MRMVNTMINDIRLLLWIEGKRLKSELAYWLKLVGVEENSSVMYSFYVALLLGFWVVSMWAYITEAILNVSTLLGESRIESIASTIPLIIFGLQFVWLVLVLRDQPLKMRAADIANLATSPIRRSAVTLIYFMRAMLVPQIIIGVVSYALVLLVTWQIDEKAVWLAGFQAFLISQAMTWITGAILWSIALLKLYPPLRRMGMWLWFLPASLAGLFIVQPNVLLSVGAVWDLSIGAHLTILHALGALVLIVASFALLIFVGEYVHFAVVADSSERYARVQRLGILGQIYARDVIARIDHQTTLAKKSRRRFNLSENVGVYRALWERAWLSLLRLSPASLWGLVSTGLRYMVAILVMVRILGGHSLLGWIAIMVLAVQVRPSALIEPFEQNIQHTFLRQFLPYDTLSILIADSITPILIASFGAFLLLLPMRNVAALVLVPLILTLLTLCQGLAWLKVSAFGDYRRIGYEYSAAICGVIIIIFGYLYSNLWAAVVICGALIYVLSGWMKSSRLA
jgi:hypothetical protein